MPTIIRFSSSGPFGPSGRGPRNRAQTIALAVVALGAGALLLAFGLVLLAGLAAVGIVVGSGVAIYHRLTGRWPGLPRTAGGAMRIERVEGLDPAKQVFPEAPRRLPGARGDEDASGGDAGGPSSG